MNKLFRPIALAIGTLVLARCTCTFALTSNGISLGLEGDSTPTPTATATAIPTATPTPSPTVTPTPDYEFYALVAGDRPQTLYSSPNTANDISDASPGTIVRVFERLAFTEWVLIQLDGAFYFMSTEQLAPVGFSWDQIPVTDR